MSRKRTKIERCRYCGAQIREARVLVGEPPGHEERLMIDTQPHPDGVVIQRRDGWFRQLGDARFRKAGVDGFRVHGKTIEGCGVPAVERAAW